MGSLLLTVTALPTVAVAEHDCTFRDRQHNDAGDGWRQAKEMPDSFSCNDNGLPSSDEDWFRIAVGLNDPHTRLETTVCPDGTFGVRVQIYEQTDTERLAGRPPTQIDNGTSLTAGECVELTTINNVALGKDWYIRVSPASGVGDGGGSYGITAFSDRSLIPFT